MGAFNTLKTTIKCRECNQAYSADIQFKFGDTWQNEYRIGDKILWGGNDIGTRNLPKVKVYGVLSNIKCPICKKAQCDEFDIIIEFDIIKEISQISNVEDYLQGDGNFLILRG